MSHPLVAVHLDFKILENIVHSANVVCVGVGREDQVERVDAPCGQHLVHVRLVGAGVDEHAFACWRGDKHRIALPGIEHLDSQVTREGLDQGEEQQQQGHEGSVSAQSRDWNQRVWLV